VSPGRNKKNTPVVIVSVPIGSHTLRRPIFGRQRSDMIPVMGSVMKSVTRDSMSIVPTAASGSPNSPA